MTVRKREFAIRGAIGAGRSRILRQLIVEGLLLCSFGCVVGVALGLIVARALLIAGPMPFRTSENPVLRSGSIGGSWFLQLGFRC
jgi:ABC-type antimicrobial peptide transport system permease subunit